MGPTQRKSMRLIGDIHGKFKEYQSILCDYPSNSVQIGDFGVGFFPQNWHDSVNEFHSYSKHRFIRGNHDNHTKCKEMVGWIPDGHIENDIMYIGGAWSIDNPNAPAGWYRRTEGVNWWKDEECSDQQFETIIDIYDLCKPRIMVTHDCPTSIATKMFWDTKLLKGVQYKNKTASALQIMLEIHKPDLWVFGHWHFSAKLNLQTDFVCLNELEYMDI
jgi:hypothetical protein